MIPSLDKIMSALPLKMRVFIEFAFCQNRWAWGHAIAGAIGGKIGGMIAPWWIVILVALIIAVSWEVLEFIEIEKKSLTQRFLYDAIGDSFLALFFCAMSI